VEVNVRTLEEIKEEASRCERCQLARNRRHAVFGAGPADARYVYVAEHPGDQENLHGSPLCGSVGQFFDSRLIGEIGVSRSEIFVVHNVLCATPANRPPTKEEAEACRPWLMEILYTIDPVIVFALGSEAVESLTGTKLSVTHQYGRLLLANVPGRMVPYHLPVVVLSNPAFVRRLNECGGGIEKKAMPESSHIHQWLWAAQYHTIWGDRLCHEWFGDVPPQRGQFLFDPPQRLSLIPRVDPDYTVEEMEEVLRTRPEDLAEDVDGDPYSAENPEERHFDRSDDDDALDDTEDNVEGPVE